MQHELIHDTATGRGLRALGELQVGTASLCERTVTMCQKIAQVVHTEDSERTLSEIESAVVDQTVSTCAEQVTVHVYVIFSSKTVLAFGIA